MNSDEHSNGKQIQQQNTAVCIQEKTFYSSYLYITLNNTDSIT